MLTKTNNNWEEVQQIYKEKFNIPPRILDYVACEEILSLCCKGLTNEDIAFWVNTDTEYVSFVIKEFLGFDGFEHNLDLSPLVIYNNCNGNRNCFVGNIKLITSLLSKKEIYDAYYICKKFLEIENQIKIYYDERS
jgi:hypothetical protein